LKKGNCVLGHGIMGLILKIAISLYMSRKKLPRITIIEIRLIQRTQEYNVEILNTEKKLQPHRIITM